MRCKIMRTQKFMWRNIIRSIKSQKVSILHYSIDIDYNNEVGGTHYSTAFSSFSIYCDIFVRVFILEDT